jgi:hypothetical protein
LLQPLKKALCGLGVSMRILLIDSDKVRLAELRQALKDLPSVEFIEVEKAIYLEPPRGLDMIFMTLPAAEAWNPDFRSREMQILPTSLGDQEKGFPPLIVTGVNLRPEDPRDPLSQVKIVLKSALRRASAYSELHGGRVKALGFWVMDLTRGVTTTQLTDLLHEVVVKDQTAGTDPR